jgi:hypothetical protein
MFIGLPPVLDSIFLLCELRGLWPCVWPQHYEEYFSLDLGKLNPEIIRKTYPRPIQAIIKAVERNDRELGGTMGLLVKGLRASDSSGLEPIYYYYYYYYY